MHQDSDTPSVKGKNYADFSREELIAEINKLKKTKKYGLVWEYKTEEVIENFKNGQQPYLEEVQDKHIENAPGEPTNLIIEGDNFDALSILNYTHAGKIDVIYIDPPYNTGNKDFIYNDNYVDSEDTFRHSKWLSFMEPRLKLANNLLKDDGVIFISIDDNEQAQLRKLVEDIFGENSSEIMIWHKVDNDSGKLKITYRFRIEHEYIVAVYKSKEKARRFNKYLKARNYKNAYTNPDNDPRGAYKQGIISDTEEKSNKNSANYYSVTTPSGKVVTRKWRFSKEEFERLNKDNRIYYGKDGNSIPSLKVFINEPGETTPTSILDELGTAKTAGIALNEIFGEKVFSYPKPVELIKHLLKISSSSHDCILDFFAGSGTTGQAVLELNKEDGGHRQFILCTNNGDKGLDSVKIAEDITYPRIKTVITGTRQDGTKYSDGIPANLRYYKIQHEQKQPSVDANRYAFINHMEDILKIKENAFNQVEANEDFVFYKNSEKCLGLIFEPFSMNEAIEKLKAINVDKLDTKLYVFSYSRDAFEEDYSVDFGIEFKAMPEGLLKTYANITEELRRDN